MLTPSYCQLTPEPDITVSSSSIFCHILLSINIRFLLEQYLSGTLPEACVNADTITAFQAQLRHTP